MPSGAEVLYHRGNKRKQFRLVTGEVVDRPETERACRGTLGNSLAGRHVKQERHGSWTVARIGLGQWLVLVLDSGSCTGVDYLLAFFYTSSWVIFLF